MAKKDHTKSALQSAASYTYSKAGAEMTNAEPVLDEQQDGIGKPPEPAPPAKNDRKGR